MIPVDLVWKLSLFNCSAARPYLGSVSKIRSIYDAQWLANFLRAVVALCNRHDIHLLELSSQT